MNKQRKLHYKRIVKKAKHSKHSHKELLQTFKDDFNKFWDLKKKKAERGRRDD